MKILFETDKNKTICFSGPRPVKYEYNNNNLEKINSILYTEITGLLRSGYMTLLFGGAPGFDLVCAKAGLRIKAEAEFKEIELICALPFGDFSKSSHFNKYWRREYDEIIPQCKVINVCNSSGYFRDCFRLRNYFLVDNSTALICLYNGKPSGTGQTYWYGVKKQLHIINIFERVERNDKG